MIMLTIIHKYKTKAGILFLAIYLSFFLLGTLHYHKFDMEVRSTFSDTPMSDAYNDLTSDFFSICSLHQFAQTINDYHYSSSDIVQSLSKIDSILTPVKFRNFYTAAYSEKSPRAPPILIS